MKRLITGTMAAAMLVFAGCDDTPSVDKARSIATACGTAAGYACQFVKIDEHVKTAIYEVIDIAAQLVPAENETFTDAWMPVIESEVEKLVKAGKLNATSAPLVKTAAIAATTGLDYLFTSHPKWKTHEEVVAASVEGFCAEFKKVVGMALAANAEEYDKGCYDAVKARLAKPVK